jgi:hypothetical protein
MRQEREWRQWLRRARQGTFHAVDSSWFTQDSPAAPAMIVTLQHIFCCGLLRALDRQWLAAYRFLIVCCAATWR